MKQRGDKLAFIWHEVLKGLVPCSAEALRVSKTEAARYASVYHRRILGSDPERILIRGGLTAFSSCLFPVLFSWGMPITCKIVSFLQPCGMPVSEGIPITRRLVSFLQPEIRQVLGKLSHILQEVFLLAKQIPACFWGQILGCIPRFSKA